MFVNTYVTTSSLFNCGEILLLIDKPIKPTSTGHKKLFKKQTTIYFSIYLGFGDGSFASRSDTLIYNQPKPVCFFFKKRR